MNLKKKHKYIATAMKRGKDIANMVLFDTRQPQALICAFCRADKGLRSLNPDIYHINAPLMKGFLIFLQECLLSVSFAEYLSVLDNCFPKFLALVYQL